MSRSAFVCAALLILLTSTAIPEASASGTISGQVTAVCPTAGTPLLGITVDAFEVGSGDLVGSAFTDATGHYSITPLLAGDYTVTLLTPLGYATGSADLPTTVLDAQATTADFSLTCVAATGTPCATGFWKHQIGIALGGNGNAAVDAATLCSYLDAVDAHFSDNALNSVAVYDVASDATCAEKLAAAKPLINATSPSLTTGWGTAGTGPGQFDTPIGIALDASGNVYVTDNGNHRVQVFTAGGKFIRQWGSFGVGDGQFRYPRGIAVDGAGYVYVSDLYGKIQKFSSDGTFVMTFPDLSGYPNYATISSETNLDVAPTGDLIVCDFWQRRVYKFTNTGGFISTWQYYRPGLFPEFQPRDAAVDANGNIFILDGNASLPQVIKYDSNGQFLGSFYGFNGQPIWDPGNLNYPQAMALGPNGRLYISDTGNQRVQSFDTDGTLRDYWGEFGSEYGQFWAPFGIAVDASGSVYVADAGNHRIQKFGPKGEAINLNGPSAAIDRAKQSLLSLLLNVAANYLRLGDVISKDGATVSQAVTYCDHIIDNPAGDHSLAIGILDKINSGQKVNAGVIPLSTEQIAYRGALALRTFRVTPNPGPGARSFRFAMGQPGSVRLSVFDVSGRLVTQLVSKELEAGEHAIPWMATTAGGSRVGNGVYFARLETPAGSRVLKVIQLPR